MEEGRDEESYREGIKSCLGGASNGRLVIYTRDEDIQEVFDDLTWYDKSDGRMFAVAEKEGAEKKSERDIEITPSSIAGILDSVGEFGDDRIVLKLLPKPLSRSLNDWLSEEDIPSKITFGKSTNQLVILGRAGIKKLYKELDFDFITKKKVANLAGEL